MRVLVLLACALGGASAFMAPASRVPAVAPRVATPLMKDAVTRVEITIENGEPLEKVRNALPVPWRVLAGPSHTQAPRAQGGVATGASEMHTCDVTFSPAKGAVPAPERVVALPPALPHPRTAGDDVSSHRRTWGERPPADTQAFCPADRATLGSLPRLGASHATWRGAHCASAYWFAPSTRLECRPSDTCPFPCPLFVCCFFQCFVRYEIRVTL